MAAWMRSGGVPAGAAVGVLAACVAVGGCRDPRQDWADRPQNARRQTYWKPPAPTTAPSAAVQRPASAGMVRPGMLMIAGESLRSEDVISQLPPVFRNAVLTGSFNSRLRDQAREAVRSTAQRLVGEILLYRDALKSLSIDKDKDKKLDEAVDKVYNEVIARESAGNRVEFEKTIIRTGLTLDDFRRNLRRTLLGQQFLRDKLDEQIEITRDQVVGYYRDNISRWRVEASAELSVIRIAHQRFLPAGTRWSEATRAQRAAAQQQSIQMADAVRREIQTGEPAAPTLVAPVVASSERSGTLSLPPATGPADSIDPMPLPAVAPSGDRFEQAARMYSDDPSRVVGGKYGRVRPGDLVDPVLADQAFKLDSNDLSPLLVGPDAVYLVKTGEVQPARERPLREVQGEIERTLEAAQRDRLSNDHVQMLYDRSPISPQRIEEFINATLDRMQQIAEAAR